MIIQTKKPLKKRRKNDFYETPQPLVVAALELLRKRVRRPTRIDDPGAGTGVWGKEARKIWPNSQIVGIDPHYKNKPEGYDLWYAEDYLQTQYLAPVNNLVIGNPPYKFAEAFVKQGWHSLKNNGYMIFLLRLAFLESAKRGHGLWQEIPPRRSACASATSLVHL